MKPTVGEVGSLGPQEKDRLREQIVDVLWELQEARGWIDDEAVRIAAERCALTPAEVDEIARGMGASAEEVEQALRLVQGFDPTGVGARSVHECLLLQLTADSEPDPVSVEIVEKHFEDLGVFTPEESRRIRAHGEEVIAAVEARQSPFDGAFLDWRPPEAWTAPTPPPEVHEGWDLHPDVGFPLFTRRRLTGLDPVFEAQRRPA